MNGQCRRFAMKILHEIIDDEHMVDIILNPREAEKIVNNFLISEPVEFMGKFLSICITTEDDWEED